MKLSRLLLAPLLAVTLLATSAAKSDQIVLVFNLENWGGAAGNVFNQNFAMPNVLSVESVTIGLNHSWGSDIDFSMTASNGDFFDLTSDNGGSGDLGDGGSTLPIVNGQYRFVDPAGAEGGNGVWTNVGGFITEGTYDSENWFGTGWAAGVWNVTMGDDAGADDGAVGSVTIEFTTIPEPGTVGLLIALGGLVVLRRRRK